MHCWVGCELRRSWTCAFWTKLLMQWPSTLFLVTLALLHRRALRASILLMKNWSAFWIRWNPFQLHQIQQMRCSMPFER